MILSILQIITIIIMGMIGFQRGWKREVISLVGVIVSVAFLLIQGGPVVAFIVFVGVPFLIQAVGNKAQNTGVPPQSLPGPDVAAVTVASIVCFFLIIALGYVIGSKLVDKPNKPVQHLLGLIPAAISGYILATYVFAKLPLFAGLPFLSSQLIKMDFSAPNSLFISVIAILVVAVALIAGSRKKTVLKSETEVKVKK